VENVVSISLKKIISIDVNAVAGLELSNTGETMNEHFEVLTKDDRKFILKGLKSKNNFYLVGYITSSDYFQGSNFTMYKYYLRLTQDTCGLPEGFKTTVVSFNRSLPLEKGKRYAFKHLQFNQKYMNFLYIPNLSMHYLDSDEEIKEGANYLKITQFF